MRSGRVVAVWLDRHGSSVAEDVSAGATVIPIGFTVAFNADGGQLQHQPTGDVLDYVSFDADAETITLAAPLPVNWSQDDAIYVYPLSNDLKAHVRLDDDDAETQPITARVMHDLRPLLAEGVREGPSEVAEVHHNGREWVLQDVLGSPPVLDGSLIQPGTIPEGDGNPPSASPAAAIQGGIGSLFVRWEAITNHDPVTYEVHVSLSSGFNPSASTLAGEVNGTLLVIRKLPNGDPLPYGVDLHVKLIAKDVDGAAAPGSEASGQIVQANTEDIATNSVTTDQLAANSVTAGKLEAVLALITTIVAGNPGADRVQLGPSGLEQYDSLNQLIAKLGVLGEGEDNQLRVISSSDGSYVKLGPGPLIEAVSADGAKVEIDASEIYPIFRFYSPDGLNWAFINRTASSTDPTEASLGINGGLFTDGTGTDWYTRLWLRDDGATLKPVREDQTNYGGAVWVGINHAVVQYEVDSNRYGRLYIDQARVQLDREVSAVHKVLLQDDGTTWISNESDNGIVVDSSDGFLLRHDQGVVSGWVLTHDQLPSGVGSSGGGINVFDHSSPSYYVGPDGRVYLAGNVVVNLASDPNGTTLWTMPPELRPFGDVRISMMCIPMSTNPQTTGTPRVVVRGSTSAGTPGEVQIWGLPTANPPLSISLDGLSYPLNPAPPRW